MTLGNCLLCKMTRECVTCVILVDGRPKVIWFCIACGTALHNAYQQELNTGPG